MGAQCAIAVKRAGDGRLSLLGSFLAYIPSHAGGVFVAAAPH